VSVVVSSDVTVCVMVIILQVAIEGRSRVVLLKNELSVVLVCRGWVRFSPLVGLIGDAVIND
jgi:hypothetical protein